MGFPAAIAAVTAASGVASGVVQYRASQAAEDRAEYQADLQDRQATDERNTLRENMRRKMDDRRRYLAKVALHQANSGAMADTGTPLEVLGDITNRLDEEIYDYGEAALARVGQLRAGAEMSRYAAQQTAAARPISAFGSLLKTTASTYSAYDQAQYRYGNG